MSRQRKPWVLALFIGVSCIVCHGFIPVTPLPSVRPYYSVQRASHLVMEGAANVNNKIKNSLRIGLLVEPTPFTHVSGYSNRYKETLTYLKKAGDNVNIVTTDDVPNAPTQFLDYPITYTPGFRFPLYKHICLTADIKLIAYSVMKLFRPQILHVATPGPFCMAAAIYARLLRVPLIFTYHTHLPIYARDYLGFIPGIVPLTKLVLRLVHNLADMTLVTSPQLKEELEGFGIERVGVWRKGIDTKKFHPNYKNAEMRNRLTEGNPKDPLIVYIGRLGAEKKLKVLRGALDRLPNARLAIVGTGPAEEDLKEYFTGTKTVFTGVLHGEELSQAFASADCFVMPSDSETLGFVVLESMASGVPVVGANAGGIPNLIDHGKTGYLVEVGDEDMFAKRVKQIIDNEEFRKNMGMAARAEAELWDWESATMELRNVHYRKAMLNFESRSFNGFLWPRSRSKFRLFRRRLIRTITGRSNPLTAFA